MDLLNVLNKFDNLDYKNFYERDLSSALTSILPDDKDIADEELKAEIMAFDFVENYPDQTTGWGTYFGPMSVWNNGDGTAIESPSIKLVTAEMIEYWEKRAKAVVNPILKARYVGLVWDFKHKVTGGHPTHEVCRMYVKALVSIANGDYHKYDVHTYSKLERALTLSIGLNDDTLIAEVKDCLLSYERRYSVDDKPGLWGYSFDLLVGNKRVNLTESEEEEIIKELEDKLARLTAKDSGEQKTDPWAAEAAAERLGKYYRKKKKLDEVKRVVLKVGDALSNIIDEAPPMQASAWLDRVRKLYIEFNLRDEAEAILMQLRDLGPKVASELKSFSHSFEIPKEQVDDYVSAMLIGELEDIVDRIAIQFIPIREQAKEQIFNLSKQAPTMFLIGQQIQDHKGRVIAKIGSLENDIEGHIVRRISENLGFAAFFLRVGIEAAIDKKGLSKRDILAFIEKTPIIDQDRLSIIERALDAYFENDLLVFIHLIIPQIEEAIRNMVEYAGGNVLKPSKAGAFHLKTFDELLREEILKEILGEDFADYFRILFTDQRGWNVRNRVCHGLANPEMFNSQTADRVLHSLICLGLIRISQI